MSKVKQKVKQNIEKLNMDCACITLDRDALCRAMEDVIGDPDFCNQLAVARPHLLSAQPMFLSTLHAGRMQQIVSATNSILQLPVPIMLGMASSMVVAIDWS